MLRVALKSVLARKRRLFTTGFAIVLSVGFISGTLVVTALIDRTLDSLIGSSYRGIDAVVRSAKVQESPLGQPFRDLIPADTLDLVRETNGVAAAEGVIQGLPTLLDKDGERIEDTFGPSAIAFNWIEDDQLAGGTLAPGGRPPAAPDEAVIDVRTAEDFDFDVGDKITAQLVGGLRTFTITGIGGIPVDGGADGGDDGENLAAGPRVLLLELATAQELFEKPDGYDYIAARATDGTSEGDLVRTLRLLLPPDQQAITGEGFIAENEATISQLINLFTTPILAFGFISVFVGIFVIYNTFSIVVAQRTRELALLRAVGAGRPQILGSVLVEAVLVGAVASALGVALGWALAIGLKAALSQALTLPDGAPALTSAAVLVALAVGVGSTVISALVPAVGATLIPPVAAMSEVAIDRSAMSRGRRVIGSLLAQAGVVMIVLNTREVIHLGLAGSGIGAGLVMLALATLGPIFAGPLARTLGAPLPRLRGIAGRIGKENAGRNPKRTAITAVALAIGVTLVTVVSVFAASLRGAIEAQGGNQLGKVDLIVDSGSGFAGLGPDAADYLRSRPEVAVVNPVRFNIVTLLNTQDAKDEQAERGETENGSPVGESDFVIGVDRTAVFQVITFDGLTPNITELPDGQVMVLAKTAEENGWTAGDSVRVWTSVGGEQSWKIAAVFDSRFGSGAEFVTNIETLNRNAPREFQVDSTLWVTLDDDITPAAGKLALEGGLKAVAPAAGLNTVSDYLGDRLKILDSVVNLIYVLLGLSIVIALVGVGNTISLSIYERTRELGLLRAVGMVRRQLGESVEWESGIIALAGTVVGLIAGVILAVVFVDGFDEDAISPVINVTTIVVIGVLGAVAGVLASVRPAWRATKVDVLAAISSV